MKRQHEILLLIGGLALLPCQSSALVVKTWDGPGTPESVNTSAPADDPGWANLATNRTAIYLGDQWVLTATHAGGGDFVFAGGTFPRIEGSAIEINNPGSFAGTTLNDPQADLYLYRLGVDTTTGLTPEELDSSVRRLTIADRLPGSNDVLTMFGRGGYRRLNAGDSNGQFHWNSNGTEVTNTETAAEHGFKTNTFREYRWGTNKIANPSGVGGSIRSGNQMLIRFDSGVTLRDTVGFVTKFDRGLNDSGSPINDGSTPDEAQGAPGDSGGPVFWKDDGEWVLAGVMHAIYQANNQSVSHAWFGNHTAISDLSFDYYYDQIDSIRSNVLYSYEGDINLDGVATGDIVGSVATGDLGILVDNWAQTFPTAGRESWIHGDLNQDATIDLADFVLMRSALGGSISSSAFASIVGASAIPEPATLGGVLAGLAVLGMRGRRSPRHAVPTALVGR